eukprot:Transcript_13803.p1 GENE.Transcript_13803~~Transcript_13803.p1  ORF type:complete len:553 (+),score=177.09 Transcript_13803:62-1720(+)
MERAVSTVEDNGACAAAQARGSSEPLHRLPAVTRARVRQFLRQQAFAGAKRRDVCKWRWLYYRGDENYGLGNVLYDVASAAALAMVLNRSVVYGANSSDRKFGSLLRWPGVPTLEEVEDARRQARCAPLAAQRHVMLEPDKCTFHKRWRMERTHLRCFRRLLGVDWLQDRAPVMEVSKVHAFTGVQVFLKSISPAIRASAAELAHGCVPDGAARPNVFGPLLASLMRPTPAVLHALRWALARGRGGGATAHAAPWRPRIALHIRTMSGHRARNLTRAEQARRLANGAMCTQRELDGRRSPAAAAAPVGVLVSSSPEGRAAVQRLLARRSAAAAVAGGDGGDGAAPPTLLVFEWRRFVAEAPERTVRALQRSEDEAASFCASINQTEAHRCRRAAHLRDWGPDPHWVALVELLLAASASEVVVGAGYPFFKVCNTFTQLAAALADATPDWLCPLLGEGVKGCAPAQSMRLVCASQLYSTDWGSSAWRMFPAAKRRVMDREVFGCAQPTCMPTPLHPELWPDLVGSKCPSSSGDTIGEVPTIYGQPLLRTKHHG